MKTKTLVIRVTPNQEKELHNRMQANGFRNISEYIRSELFSANYEPIAVDTEDFSMLRGERRSFFCPNELWNDMREFTNSRYSLSHFIRTAIIEKMEKQ